MADATVLGIQPPATVRIEYDDSYEDWPFELVNVLGDRIEIVVTVWPDEEFRPLSQTILHYPYEHAQELPDGSWRFLGGEHAEFFVRPGAPQPLALDTTGPQ